MSIEEKLRRVFIKAKQNGWNSHGYEYIVLNYELDDLPPAIIYTHDFAKAFWGEGQPCYRCNGDASEIVDVDFGGDVGIGKANKCNSCGTRFQPKTKGVRWQYHLQQMVISEDPIKYLEAFI